MILTILTAALVGAFPSDPNAASSQCLPTPNTCDYYYQCVEPTFNCGPQGYPLGYGGHFCSAFKADLPKFTQAGQAWLWSVMNCLQQKLVPVVQEHTMTCPQLQTFAYSTHPECYTLDGESICYSLPPQDIARLLFIIKNVIFDKDTLIQAFSVVKTCGQQYFEIIKALIDMELEELF